MNGETGERDDLHLGHWAALAACVIIGVLALFYAAHSTNTPGYSLGLAIFGLAVAAAFYLVKRMGDLMKGRPG